MTEIAKNASSLEPVVAPLIDATNTTRWRRALAILYMNGDALEIPGNTKIPCLVGVKGPPAEKAKDSIELLMGRAKTQIIPLIKEFIMPHISALLSKFGGIATEIEDDPHRTIVNMLADTMIRKQDEVQAMTVKLLLRGAFAIPSITAAGLFQALEEIRAGQATCTIGGTDYDGLVESLLRLGLIEPKLQVSICPECSNYQITISPCPTNKTTCPSCGGEWATRTIYMFKSPYDKVKAQNQDLPLFISSYLKLRTTLTNITEKPEIHPNAELRKEDTAAEVDVYIPRIKMGIECKVYHNPNSPMTTSRLGIAGNLRKQLENYAKLGLTHIIIVTNLPEHHAKKIEEKLQEHPETPEVDKIEVIPGNTDKLLQFLDELAQQLLKG